MAVSGRFLGPTKGNANVHPCRSEGENGGSGDSHAGAPSGKYLGSTKGNTNLPPDRTANTPGGRGGGPHKAGGKGS